jgi:hypothetical protein
MRYIRDGMRRKAQVSEQIPNGGKMKCRESIEVLIKDWDGKVLWRWEAGRGNLNQGLYETLDFAQKKLNLDLNDVLYPKPKPQEQPAPQPRQMNSGAGTDAAQPQAT